MSIRIGAFAVLALVVSSCSSGDSGAAGFATSDDEGRVLGISGMTQLPLEDSEAYDVPAGELLVIHEAEMVDGALEITYQVAPWEPPSASEVVLERTVLIGVSVGDESGGARGDCDPCHSHNFGGGHSEDAVRLRTGIGEDLLGEGYGSACISLTRAVMLGDASDGTVDQTAYHDTDMTADRVCELVQGR